MGKYSRTKKYEELRNNILNDAETEIKSNDLSRFANRLNELDANQFDKMEVKEEVNHDATHLRDVMRSEPVEFDFVKPTQSATVPPHPTNVVPPLPHEPEMASGTTETFLDEYLSEVKDYNVKKGYTEQADTQTNILNVLKGSPKIIRPYGDIETPYQKSEPVRVEKEVVQPKVQTYAETIQDVHEGDDNDLLADIPFLSKMQKAVSIDDLDIMSSARPVMVDEQPTKVVRPIRDEEEEEIVRTKKHQPQPEYEDDDYDDDYDDEDYDDEYDDDDDDFEATTHIAVQKQKPSKKTKKSRFADDYDDDDDDYDEEEYEEVEEELPSSSNRILNFILVILILLLVVMLGVVAYWLLLSKGII